MGDADDVANEDTNEPVREWRPGDPDRRRTGRSLLSATNTTADEHRPRTTEDEARS